MGYRTAGTDIAHKLKTKRSARIGIVILIWGMLALITEAQYEPRSAVVERVIDGDTIEVRVDGQTHTVRLIGVDTPETKHPTKSAQYFGREASAFTQAAFEGKAVALKRSLRGFHRPLRSLASLCLPAMETTSTPGSSARATLTLTEGLPSQNDGIESSPAAPKGRGPS